MTQEHASLGRRSLGGGCRGHSLSGQSTAPEGFGEGAFSCSINYTEAQTIPTPEVANPRLPSTVWRVTRAWKFVDLEHADAVGSGSIKIGTLASYAQIENGRADQLDGAVTFNVNLSGGVPEHRAAAARIGFHGLQEGMGMSECFVTQKAQPANAFCMSAIGCRHDPTPDRAKAVFEINTLLLQWHLSRKLAEQFSYIMWGPVSYEPRIIDALANAGQGPDPFIKDPKFEAEQEIRMYFHPRSGRPLPGTIVTGADPAIAACIKRIG